MSVKKFLYICLLLLVTSVPARAQENEDDWYKPYDLIEYSELRKLIDDDQVDSARVLHDGWWVTIKTKEGEFFDVRVTPQTPIADHFFTAGIPVAIEHKNRNNDEDELSQWQRILFDFLPLLIFIVFFIFVLWFSQRRGKKVQDDCLSRAEAINNDFLDQQQKQFETFIEDLSSVLKKKDSNG